MEKKLKILCESLGEDEPEINRNFWVVNMHGDETEEIIDVPKGVRIILFCYSGKKLHICPRFDRFNWERIFLNPDASFNYCTFLANLAQYSSLREHFCIYNSGEKLKNLKLTHDENFRDGIYSLPVSASVYDEEADTVFVSSEDIFADVVEKSQVKRIVLDKKAVAERIKDKDNKAVFFSKTINYPVITLSALLRKLQSEVGSEVKKEFTILLLTCRTGEKIAEKRGTDTTVKDELQKLFKTYKEDIKKNAQ